MSYCYYAATICRVVTLPFASGVVRRKTMARKVYNAHGKGDTPATSFLAKREDEQSALYRSLIKSVKKAGGVIKDVNKYMTYSIFSHPIAKAEECAGRQPKLCVAYLYIHHQK